MLAALATAGCSSAILDAPVFEASKPSGLRAYLPVHDLPPERDEPLIAPDERARIQKELVAARERQASAPAKPK